MPIIANNSHKNETQNNFSEEIKDSSLKHLSKFEHDLYNEEDDIALPVIRVKRISLPNKGDRWKVFSDNKVVFTIESSKLLKKEKEFLQTIDGFNFILSKAKVGIKSLHNFRLELKKVIDKAPVHVEIEKVSKTPKKLAKRGPKKKKK